MSRIDASAWTTGVDPLEVELPGGETVRFLTLLDLPMEESMALIQAGLAAGKLADRVTPENLADLMRIMRTMVDSGLTPEDRQKWIESRVPLVACMKLIPVLSAHYQASDGAFAALNISAPQMPSQPPTPVQPQYQGQQMPSAYDLIAQQNTQTAQTQQPWQQPEVMSPGEANGSPTFSTVSGGNYGEIGSTGVSTSAFGQTTPNGTPSF